MAWNNQRKQKSNYERPERPMLEQEHAIDPKLLMIINKSEELVSLMSEGSTLATEIIKFSGPSGEVSVEACKAFLVTGLSFAVPFDNPHYPKVGKIDTEVKRNSYYPMYVSRIFWKHSDQFWHIPGFSRYVIDKFGNVKNAYNGLDIKPNDWGSLVLVPDMAGDYNKPRAVQPSLLKALAFKQLPTDFKDYGFGNYNYELEYSNETKTIDWVKRPTVIVQDMGGQVSEADNVTEFAIRFLKGKMRGEFIKSAKESRLRYGPVDGGSFTAKLKGVEPIKVPHVEVVVETQIPVQETKSDSLPLPENNFDEDINF